MRTKMKKNADSNAETQTRFNIQVCSEDGRLLSEYDTTQCEIEVHTLKAAERCARNNLSDYKGEPLVVVVSEHTLTNLRQVQLRVAPDESCIGTTYLT
jgi:hypothetical protein